MHLNEIEVMKQAGWIVLENELINASQRLSGDDLIIFTRPKQVPNAYVDFEALEQRIKEYSCGAFKTINQIIRKIG